jgi:hypothetical protein
MPRPLRCAFTGIALLVLATTVASIGLAPAAAAPEGTLTFALHYTLPPRWLDRSTPCTTRS